MRFTTISSCGNYKMVFGTDAVCDLFVQVWDCNKQKNCNNDNLIINENSMFEEVDTERLYSLCDEYGFDSATVNKLEDKVNV